MVKNRLLAKSEAKQEKEIETDNIKLIQLAHTGHPAHRQSLRKNASIESTAGTVWKEGKQYFNLVLQCYPKNLLKTLSPVIEIVFGTFYD